MNRSTRTLAATAALAALALSGCGVEERIVHLQAAPTESAAGAPLRHDAAERIATRVLAQAAAATTAEERAAVVVGPAGRITSARIAAKVPAEAASDVAVPAVPTVLAVSDGQDWPRAILASTFDDATQVQSVHLLVSESATEQFRLFATAPMLAGTSVPSLGDFADGAKFETGTAEAPIELISVVQGYAKGLAFPTPEAVEGVSLDDPFAQSLKSNAKAQNDALGDLANLTRTATVVPDSVVRFETADGGQLLFAQLVRLDTIALTAKAKELKIESTTLQELSGKKVVTKAFKTESFHNLLMVIPASGNATLIGAEELVQSASGT